MSNTLRIALGTDHAGFALKEAIKRHLKSLGHDVVDFGTDSTTPVDYPDFIHLAAESVGSGESDVGVVFGGSGNGEAITANKTLGIRCGVCWNVWSARKTKEHNNANMIALGGRVVSAELAIEIVDEWLGARFAGGRHSQRISKIETRSDG